MTRIAIRPSGQNDGHIYGHGAEAMAIPFLGWTHLPPILMLTRGFQGFDAVATCVSR